MFDTTPPEFSPAQLSWLTSLQTDLFEQLAKLDLTPLIEVFRRNGPPNWRDLDPDIVLGPLLEIAERGIPTAWVPRAAVLEALAAEQDRPAVLVAHRDQVLEDCDHACSEITAPELHEQVTLLREALNAARDGHLAAAQALAAAIFDTALRHTFKIATNAEYDERLKQAIQDNHNTALITDLRWNLVHVPAVAVLDPYQPGDPVPTEFNRHASVHAASTNQYHPANALVALMLAASLLREAHEDLIDPPTKSSQGSTP